MAIDANYKKALDEGTVPMDSHNQILVEQEHDENGLPTRMSGQQAQQDPGVARGALVQAQRLDFQNRFKPLEQRLMDEISRSPEDEARKAGKNMKHQSRVTRGSFKRDLSRSGDSLTKRQSGTINRKRGLAEARSMASAKNMTRRNVRETNLARQGELIGIGRGVQQGANTDLSAAASLQNSREMANSNAAAAKKQGDMQMAGMAVGLMMMI